MSINENVEKRSQRKKSRVKVKINYVAIIGKYIYQWKGKDN